MMKRSLSVLFIGVFLLLCLIPSVGMLIAGPSPLLANESAPRTPALLDRDGNPNPAVLADTTDYIGTRFALRPLLVSARSFSMSRCCILLRKNRSRSGKTVNSITAPHWMITAVSASRMTNSG